MSALVTAPRIIRSALRSFYRNGWLSVAATGIVTFSLVLVSIFALLLLLGTNVISAIQSKIDVEVFFKDLDLERGDSLVAHGWAMEEDLRTLNK